MSLPETKRKYSIKKKSSDFGNGTNRRTKLERERKELLTGFANPASVAQRFNIVHRAKTAAVGMRGVHGGRGHGRRVSRMARGHRAHAHRAARIHGDRRHAHRRERRHREIRPVRVDALQRLNALPVAHRPGDHVARVILAV